ncbi:hypothetical protein AURDEDRAFT_115421 [Auricularia subglabra TFB-10046 SS5]|nr:hypothetical protein AURDEDRAFT_115421 [Auricularia subglabra TFB-10046 SS5]
MQWRPLFAFWSYGLHDARSYIRQRAAMWPVRSRFRRQKRPPRPEVKKTGEKEHEKGSLDLSNPRDQTQEVIMGAGSFWEHGRAPGDTLPALRA